MFNLANSCSNSFRICRLINRLIGYGSCEVEVLNLILFLHTHLDLLWALKVEFESKTIAYNIMIFVILNVKVTMKVSQHYNQFFFI